MDTKFEKISKQAEVDIPQPIRKTQQSAGYDMVAAEDTIIPSYLDMLVQLSLDGKKQMTRLKKKDIDTFSLKDMGDLTKAMHCRPALVPTGYKCKLAPDQYLELSIRSSSPLKYWLVLANAVGIIDADQYNNADNEGHIFFQLINLSPFPIVIQKGEAIGQAIVKKYETLAEDNTTNNERSGGFGSTK